MSAHQEPPDIEVGLVTYLRGLGEDAATRVPATRKPGMIRVARTGGHIPNEGQDAPVITVEVWDTTEDKTYQRARDLWVLLTAVERAGTVWIQDADLDPPIMYPDPQAPELFRAQFSGTLRTRMEPASI